MPFEQIKGVIVSSCPPDLTIYLQPFSKGNSIAHLIKRINKAEQGTATSTTTPVKRRKREKKPSVVSASASASTAPAVESAPESAPVSGAAIPSTTAPTGVAAEGILDAVASRPASGTPLLHSDATQSLSSLPASTGDKGDKETATPVKAKQVRKRKTEKEAAGDASVPPSSPKRKRPSTKLKAIVTPAPSSDSPLSVTPTATPTMVIELTNVPIAGSMTQPVPILNELPSVATMSPVKLPVSAASAVASAAALSKSPVKTPKPATPKRPRPASSKVGASTPGTDAGATAPGTDAGAAPPAKKPRKSRAKSVTSSPAAALTATPASDAATLTPSSNEGNSATPGVVIPNSPLPSTVKKPRKSRAKSASSTPVTASKPITTQSVKRALLWPSSQRLY